MADALPVGERPQLAPPIDETGPLGWARKHLFSSWLNGLVTIALVVAIGWILSWFLQWAVFTANFTATTGAECRGGGACWALIREKYRLIFFGTYPYEQHWRPLFAVIAMLAMLVLSADRRMWNWRLLVIWGIGSFITFLLMFGQIHIPLSLILFVALVVGLIGMALRKGIADAGEMNAYRALAVIGFVGLVLRILGVLPAWSLAIAPLSYVETSMWGGIPVTLILATYGLVFAFPYGILPALEPAADQGPVRGLHRADPRRAADQPPDHGLGHAAAVPAERRDHRQVPACPGRRHPVRRRLHRRDHQGRPAVAAQGPVRGGRCDGPQLRAEAPADHPAAGPAGGDPALDQHLHRLLQGHLAGADHRHLRLPQQRQPGALRPQLGRLPRRNLSVRRLHLFLLLFLDVALQQVSRGRTQQGNAPLEAARRTHQWLPV